MADPFGTLAPGNGLFGLMSPADAERNQLAELLRIYGRQNAMAGVLASQQRDPAKIGPPTVQPGSFNWWVDQALGFTPVGSGRDLAQFAQDAEALPPSPSFGQLAPVIGSGILAATGMIPGGKAVGKAAKKGGDLAMDLVSRQARADKMFPVDVYHGTAGDFIAFDRARAGQTMPGPVSSLGVSVSPDPRVASHFAEVADRRQKELYDQAVALDERPPAITAGPSVMPLRLDPGKQANVRLPDDHSPAAVANAIQDAWDAGYDSVRLTNYTEVPGVGASEMVIVRRPEAQLRSRFARFNPAKKERGNLMDSLVPLGTFGGVAYMMMPDEASAAP